MKTDLFCPWEAAESQLWRKKFGIGSGSRTGHRRWVLLSHCSCRQLPVCVQTLPNPSLPAGLNSSPLTTRCSENLHGMEQLKDNSGTR